MTTPDTDAQLVASHLAGDPSALAGIYDRYANSLHDTAAAMLNDRHESADVLQDVILIAAERLGQLRDPERLKPWLFAILRNEVYRRTKNRKRTIATDFSGGDDGYDMADDRHLDVDEEVIEDTAGDDLAALVRGAARGLDERDQLVLELSVRQGLEGQDLADALGVSANQSYTLVHRMRERVERSLSAFVVAKAGRKDCDDLDKLLSKWDGEFTVLIRKRVARHIDNCEVCDTHRGKVAPLALFAGAPVFAAPVSLRDRILDAAAVQAAAPSTPYGFTADGGFPQVVRMGRRVAAWVAPTAAASLVLVVASLSFFWLNRTSDADSLRGATIDTTTTLAPETTTTELAVVPSSSTSSTTSTTAPTTTTTVPATTTTAVTTTVAPTTEAPAATQPPPPPPPPVTAAPTPTSPPATSPPATAPPTTAAPATTTPTTTTTTTTTTTEPPAPGQLSLSGGLINLGSDSNSGSVTVSNTGGQPIDYTVAGATAPFTVSPTSGTLRPGETQQIVASIDRSGLPEGQTQFRNVQVSGGGQSFPLDLQASVERPPSLSASTPSVFSSGPFGAGCVLYFSGLADISDESPPITASFAVSGGPLGQSGSTALSPPTSVGPWSGTIQIGYVSSSEVNGTWSWSMTATDSRGNTSNTGGNVTVTATC